MVRAILFVIVLVVGIAQQGSGVAAQDSTPATPPPLSESVQDTNGEALDSISLDRTVYFVTRDGTDAIVAPGLYRVEAVEPASLRLISATGREALTIQALTM